MLKIATSDEDKKSVVALFERGVKVRKMSASGRFRSVAEHWFFESVLNGTGTYSASPPKPRRIWILITKTDPEPGFSKIVPE